MSQNTSKSKAIFSVILYVLILAGVVGGLFYFINKTTGGVSLGGKSGLSVASLYDTAQVFVDSELLGETPFESEELSSGDRVVTIKTSDRQYELSLGFVSGTQVALNRDLGVSDIFSSGQNFWMDKGGSDVLSVDSSPEGASVFIDNTEVGKTPYTDDNLSEGEYDLRVEFSGYESQTARINIKNGYKLYVAMDLFPLPVPVEIKPFDGSQGLYNVVSDNPLVVAEVGDWIKAIVYWNQTRGINLVGTGMNKELVFEYFLDYRGNLYTGDGTLITSQEAAKSLEGVTKGAYLGRFEDGEGLTQEARETYEGMVLGVLGGRTATINPTGVGWLRVRSTPGLTGVEVGRATVGESYSVLEEGTGWVKIKVSDTVTGWVSADYVSLSD